MGNNEQERYDLNPYLVCFRDLRPRKSDRDLMKKSSEMLLET